jgi:hypothetical protein
MSVRRLLTPADRKAEPERGGEPAGHREKIEPKIVASPQNGGFQQTVYLIWLPRRDLNHKMSFLLRPSLPTKGSHTRTSMGSRCR